MGRFQNLVDMLPARKVVHEIKAFELKKGRSYAIVLPKKIPPASIRELNSELKKAGVKKGIVLVGADFIPLSTDEEVEAYEEGIFRLKPTPLPRKKTGEVVQKANKTNRGQTTSLPRNKNLKKSNNRGQKKIKSNTAIQQGSANSFPTIPTNSISKPSNKKPSPSKGLKKIK